MQSFLIHFFSLHAPCFGFSVYLFSSSTDLNRYCIASVTSRVGQCDNRLKLCDRFTKGLSKIDGKLRLTLTTPSIDPVRITFSSSHSESYKIIKERLINFLCVKVSRYSIIDSLVKLRYHEIILRCFLTRNRAHGPLRRGNCRYKRFL